MKGTVAIKRRKRAGDPCNCASCRAWKRAGRRARRLSQGFRRKAA